MIDVVNGKVENYLDVAKELDVTVVGLKSLCFKEGCFRKFFESSKVDVIYNLETSFEKSKIFYKNSGLNHILCSLAHDNDIIIGFNFSLVLDSSDFLRAEVLSRMRQNVRLCRKFKVKMMISTFAADAYSLRGWFELFSFGKLIGMTDLEAKNALNAVNERIEFNKFKKSSKYVCEGVEVVE